MITNNLSRVFACTVIFFLLPAYTFAQSTKRAGIWYSTWYTKLGNYHWAEGHGVGSTHQYSGDVNGDGMDDAIVYFDYWDAGATYISLSTGAEFASFSRWTDDFASSAKKRFFADVNGDGRDDFVAFFANGDWKVALSNGTRFETPQTWKTGHGYNSDNQLLGDINGDSLPDAVVTWKTWQGGAWYVALSSGSEFGSSARWNIGLGGKDTIPLLGDLDGDGAKDAIVFDSLSGDWLVGISTRSSFAAPYIASQGYGVGSDSQHVGDIDGDGRDDLITYFQSIHKGAWYAALSSGITANISNLWHYGHGGGESAVNYYLTSDVEILANVTGKGLSPVVYFGERGLWRVMPPGISGQEDYYANPAQYNSWEAWEMNVYPNIAGEYKQYDSADPSVIEFHLYSIGNAGIDFLLYDVTNSQHHWIVNRARAVSKRIQERNMTGHRNMQYAAAIGFPHPQQQTLEEFEQQAERAYHNFLSSGSGLKKQDYFHLRDDHDGQLKPLLVAHDGIRKIYSDEQIKNGLWAQNFTIKWWGGWVIHTHTKPAHEWKDYWGWRFNDGTLPNPDLMHVQPGHVNPNDGRLPRTYQGEATGHYRIRNWDRVLHQDPNMVIINSYNEYAEETAVAPTDTSMSLGEKWFDHNGQLSPNLYWSLTVEYLNRWKGQ